MLKIEKQIFHQIEKSKNILIIFRDNNDGDSLSAALAFYNYLFLINKKVDIVISDNAFDNNRHSLSFLTNFDKISNKITNIRQFIVSLDIKNSKISQIKYSLEDKKLNFIISPSTGWFSSEDVSSKASEFKYDLIINIGVNDLESLGELYDNNIEFFYKTPIINIDNKAENEDYGQINLVDINSLTICEMIYSLIKDTSTTINEAISTCLLAGIIKKTKNYRSGNLNPKTLLSSSELINLGANRSEIVKNLFYSKDINSLKLWGEVLKSLSSEQEGEFVWSTIEGPIANDIENKSIQLNNIIDELITSLPNARLFVLLAKRSDDIVLLCFSLKNQNCQKLLEDYKPEGNQYYAKSIIKNTGFQQNEIIRDLLKKYNDINS